MSKTKHPSDSSEPLRLLRSDFTASTLRYAVRAKQRAQAKQQFVNLIKGEQIMKSLRFMRTAPGVAALLVTITAGSTGVYALNNWFNGNVTVKQADSSIISVDLSQCKGVSLGGIDSPSNDVKFKILKQPAISAGDLQKKLLADCEYQSVLSFYRDKMPAAFKDGGIAPEYYFGAATVHAVNSNGTISLDYSSTVGVAAVPLKTFQEAQGATVFSLSQPSSLQALHAGDTVVVVTSNPETNIPEGGDAVNPLVGDKISVLSIFKTQYDVNDMPSSVKGFYNDNNIMPLDMYERLSPTVKQSLLKDGLGY
jgi:hypothetical protein